MNEQSAALIRAARGPLIIITVGVLFAIDRFSEYHFSKTWPILLIVVGVLRLLGGSRFDRFRDRMNQGPYNPGWQAPPPTSAPPPPPPYDPPGGRP